jgi:SagB-type dehydrogenase family enzyme
LSLDAVGELLRCSMGLSAWKQYGNSRWALRVNPSSGNLHPTEAYVVWNGQVCHYAPQQHALEVRAELRPPSPSSLPAADSSLLVGLTSIHWREAWKYGERAYRYCQHDAGHAIGALRIAASLLGWRLTLLPEWSDDNVAALLGLDRDGDYADAEREHPDCIALVSADTAGESLAMDPAPLVAAARAATWHGTANRLSAGHVDWPIIEEVASATKYAGLTRPAPPLDRPAVLYPRELLLQRRSATAFDGRYALRSETFFSMLAALQPDAPPWDAVYWPAHVHLALFVHRVDGLTPGVYAYLRDPAVRDEWRAAMRAEFLWEQPEAGVPLYLLLPIDAKRMAQRVSCDQDIAGDGFFSLGMIARFEDALRQHGASFYRRLFWESGLIGQVLYLAAEANGVRATGIGCYYDDPVHEMLGLQGHAWQSLYHLAVGMPVDDARLTTEPGYAWEESPRGRRDP